MHDKINNLIVNSSESVLFALKKMDAERRKLLLVYNNGKFLNVISIGDIQRAILKNTPLSEKIEDILRKEVCLAKSSDSLLLIKERMLNLRTEFMPVVNDYGDLVDIIFWEDLFDNKETLKKTNLNLPVIIMAGGQGTRLKPLTNIIPKPLIPLNEKTIIEEIMDRFASVGCKEFYLSVNYKAEIIRQYFDQLQSDKYIVDYFQEVKPLGTAGSLYLIKDKIKNTFFVSNCDIIIDEDYSEILNYHIKNQNEMTIVSALKHYPIPYGTIETGNNGLLIELREKPELTMQINTGFYILEPHLLNEIPDNQFFHITTLIENIKKRAGKVGVFPVSSGSWIDIGDMNEYLKYIKIEENIR